MYSSGTTGRPKGVMLTQHNMVKHTINAHDGWAFDPGDKNLVAMPLFHVGGSSYVLFGIHDGVPSVMTRDPDSASLAGAILAGANRTFLVPAVLAQVLQSGPEAIGLFGKLKLAGTDWAIPYGIVVGDRTLTLGGAASYNSSLGTDRARRSVPFRFAIGNVAQKRAGTYSDVITVSISVN